MLDATGYPAVCPQCDTEFTPRRSNQAYCARSCQKNSSRGNRSRENTDRTLRHFERSQRLFEMIYATPPSERLGAMQHILSFIPVDSGLRNILTDPALLSERPRVDGKKNIAKAADAYTKKFFGVSISTYVRKTRNGVELDAIPVTPVVIPLPVPNLRKGLTRQTFRCICTELLPGPLEVSRQMRNAAEAIRASDPDLADRLNLLADVKQAGAVTEDDYDRVKRLSPISPPTTTTA